MIIELKYDLGSVLKIDSDVFLVESIRKTLKDEVEYMLTSSITQLSYWKTETQIDIWLDICAKLGKYAEIYATVKDFTNDNAVGLTFKQN